MSSVTPPEQPETPEHDETPGIPHVDTPAGPLVDMWAIPHIDKPADHTSTLLPHTRTGRCLTSTSQYLRTSIVRTRTIQRSRNLILRTLMCPHHTGTVRRAP